MKLIPTLVRLIKTKNRKITDLRFFILCILFSLTLYAEEFYTRPAAVDFSAVTVNVQSQKFVWVVNHSSHEIEITATRDFITEMTVSPAAGIISAGDSMLFTVRINAAENINYNSFIAFESNQTGKSLVVPVTASAYYADNYYASTQNLWAENLKTALNNLVSNHNSLGYTLARDYMYGDIDNDNGWVECVYTGRTAQFSTRAGATSNSFNCEHTWPQGGFDEDEPMRSDIFHLYPTDIAANSARSSFPFGNVVSNVSWSNGGSSLGSDASGNTVFEPRDSHKGDAARSIFYFLVRYGNIYDYHNNGSWNPMLQSHEDVLRTWHESDLPDNKEIDRNQAVYSYQNNRNPFIDHPEFLDRISSLTGSAQAPVIKQAAVSPLAVDFGNGPLSQEVFYQLSVINTGNQTVFINSVTVSDSGFSTGNFPQSIAAGQFGSITVSFIPNVPGHIYAATITINTSAGNFQVSVSGQGNILDIENNLDFPGTFKLYPNYPNPFNPATTLQFNLPVKSAVAVQIYDIEGKSIHSQNYGSIRAGSNQLRLNFNELNISASGVYFIMLQAGKHRAVNKVIYLQ